MALVRTVVVIALLWAALGTALPALGEGELETTFGANGVIRDRGSRVAMQPDGRLVTVAALTTETVLRRFDSAGRPDTSFGTAGEVRLPRGPSFADLAVHPDGSLFILGSETSQGTPILHLLKLGPNGGPVAAFGNGGVVVGRVEQSSSGWRLALQEDGRIVVLAIACCQAGFNSDRVYVLRFLPDGTADASFQGGHVLVPEPMNGEALTIDDLGNVVVAGWLEGSQYDAIVARLLPDGRSDVTFGAGGVARIAVTTSEDRPTDLLVDPLGRLHVVSNSRGSSALYPLLGSHVSRLRDDGSLDTTFAGTGIVSMADVVPVALPGIEYWLRAGTLAWLPDGRLLVAGAAIGPGFTAMRYIPTNFSEMFAIALREDGSVDTGLAFHFFVPEESWQWKSFISDDPPDVAIDPSGGVVIVEPGCSCLVRFRTANWDTVPDALAFDARPGVVPGSVQTSAMRTVTGLGAGVSVPFRITGGEWARDGATTYSTGVGTLRNGTQIDVRHVTSSAPGQTATTVVEAGGLRPNHNRALIVGSLARSEFVSTTNAPPSITNASLTAELAEDAAVGTVVATIDATDRDRDPLRYRIVQGDTTGRFAIDDAGRVTVAAGLDFETTSSFALTVEIDDGRSSPVSATVTINVTDVSESSSAPAPSPAPTPAPSPAPTPAASAPQGSGGGGGSTDVLHLALLVAAWLLRLAHSSARVPPRVEKELRRERHSRRG